MDGIPESYSSKNSTNSLSSASRLALLASPIVLYPPRYLVFPLKVICEIQSPLVLLQYTPRTPDVLFFGIVFFSTAALTISTHVPSTRVRAGSFWHPQLAVWPDIRLDWRTVVCLPQSQMHRQ